MLKNIIKLFSVILISTFVTISAKAETVIQVVDFQSGVGGPWRAHQVVFEPDPMRTDRPDVLLDMNSF